jgi:hypothetical protein
MIPTGWKIERLLPACRRTTVAKKSTLGDQVRDAKRVVAKWPKEKRESVRQEGGMIDSRSYSSVNIQ